MIVDPSQGIPVVVLRVYLGIYLIVCVKCVCILCKYTWNSQQQNPNNEKSGLGSPLALDRICFKNRIFLRT